MLFLPNHQGSEPSFASLQTAGGSEPRDFEVLNPKLLRLGALLLAVTILGLIPLRTVLPASLSRLGFQPGLLLRTVLVREAHALAPGVAVEVQLNEALVQVSDGLIICDPQFGKILCKQGYSQDMYGVIDDAPAVALINTSELNTRPIITSGRVYVQVTTQGGEIKKGDYITSSEVEGVGQKSERSGQMLGIALENYASDDTKRIGKILVELNIRPVVLEARTMIDKVRNQIRIIAGPARVGFRHALAAVVTAIAIGVGVGFFGKVMRSGVESVGRNPRASGKIQLSMGLNLALTVAVMGVGLIAAYFILTI